MSLSCRRVYPEDDETLVTTEQYDVTSLKALVLILL
jgi:hypothetical protein